MHGTCKREWVWLIIAKNSIDSIVNERDWPWVGKFNMALHTNYESVMLVGIWKRKYTIVASRDSLTQVI